jgi:hypothetical protein
MDISSVEEWDDDAAAGEKFDRSRLDRYRDMAGEFGQLNPAFQSFGAAILAVALTGFIARSLAKAGVARGWMRCALVWWVAWGIRRFRGIDWMPSKRSPKHERQDDIQADYR